MWSKPPLPRLPPILPRNKRTLLTLAIETSCDDTCVALLSTSPPTSSPRAAKLLYNGKSTSDNRRFGGVYPPAALAGHSTSLAPLLRNAISHMPSSAHRPDIVAVTRGPGMMANLTAGLNTAKGLALAWGVPLLGVNHMQAHALTPRLVDALSADGVEKVGGQEAEFPFLTLLVSGGHTMLVDSRSVVDHRILVAAASMAVGDALDKCARLILPPEDLASCPDVMYARALESFAFPTDVTESPTIEEYEAPSRRELEIAPLISPHGWRLVRPLAETRRLAYDFTCLVSQIQSLTTDPPTPLTRSVRRALAIDIMRVAFEHLAGRIVLALAADTELASKARLLVVSGGVASNRFLAAVLRRMLDARGFRQVRVVAPPPHLCTDNAAMIAWAAVEMFEAGYESDMDVDAIRKWSVDPANTDGGILGASGWKRRT